MRLVAVGSIYFEINVKLHTPSFRENIEENIDEFEETIGGSIAYFTRSIQKLGTEAILIAKVGDDTRAESLVSLCKSENITTRFIIDSHVSTNTAINISNQSGNMIMGIDKSASSALTPQEIDNEIGQINNIDILYISSLLKSPHLIEYWDKTIPKLKESGVKVVLDYGRSSEPLTSEMTNTLKSFISSHVDILLPSREDRFCELMNTKSEKDALIESFKSFPNTITVLKQDKDGASYLSDGEVKNIPTTPIITQSSVGAGDIFNAGFINSYLEKNTGLTDSIKEANNLALGHLKLKNPSLNL